MVQMTEMTNWAVDLIDVRKTYADISKAKKLMGYAPKVGFEEGLERTFDWFKLNWKGQVSAITM